LDRINASQLKALASSPVEYYHRFVEGATPPSESAAMAFGTLLHLWAEKGESVFWDLAKRYPDEVLTATGQLGKDAKAWAAAQPEGSVLITPSDWRRLYDQTRMILRHKGARRLLESAVDREFNVLFDWNGNPCKCRSDGATEGEWFDLKTTKDPDPQNSSHHSVSSFHYDIQAAFYYEASRQAGWPEHSLQFIWTSTTPPYLCDVSWLPPDVMRAARHRCEQLLVELQYRKEWNCWLPENYGECHEMNWPNWKRGGR
jgi:hypothetical protein